MIEGVEVRLMQRPRALGSTMYFEVLVRSQVKPRLKLKGMREFERRDQSQVISALAGTLAEELCDSYSDTIEPSAVARAAVEAYRELLADNPHTMLGDELPS